MEGQGKSIMEAIVFKRKRGGKVYEDKTLSFSDKPVKDDKLEKKGPPSQVSFAAGTPFAAQALTPKRHCNVIPMKPSLFSQTPRPGPKLQDRNIFSSTPKPYSSFAPKYSCTVRKSPFLFSNAGEKTSTLTHTSSSSASSPHSPPSTPFRFNSFPASLPRVHPRQKSTKLKEDENDEFLHRGDISHDTINTSISSISVGSPVLRCTSPRREKWDGGKVPPQLFLSEFEEEKEIAGTKLDFKNLSPNVGEKNEEEVTPVQDGKEILKPIHTNDLTQPYDSSRTCSFPSVFSKEKSSTEHLSTPPRFPRSLLDHSSITRQEQFQLETSQCSPIKNEDSPCSSPSNSIIIDEPAADFENMNNSTLSTSHISSGSSTRRNRPMPDMTAFDATSAIKNEDSRCFFPSSSIIIDEPAADFENMNNSALSTSRISSGSSTRKNRPMPDMAAFDAATSVHSHNHSLNTSFSSPLKVICPPTPVRTPAWAHNESHSPVRKDSLITSKVLAACPPSMLDGFTSFEHSLGDSNSSFEKELHPLHLEERRGEIGDVISFNTDFEILGQLGSGSFADVFKARCKSDQTLYAVKRNRRQFRGKKDRERALREVRTMQKLQSRKFCPYLLLFVRAWQEDGYFFCQTELCCRDSCRTMLQSLRGNWNQAMKKYPSLLKNLPGGEEGRLTPEGTIWKICHDVVSGLAHIHSCGMVHYDIKPSNIFFVSHGRLGCICKIGDFGITGGIGSSEDGQEGDTKYMPQELLSSCVKHPSADIFSFGLTLYELACDVTWELPLEGPKWHEIRSAGHVLELPGCRSEDLAKLIRVMIGEKSKRLSAEEILDKVWKVKEAATEYDVFLADYVRDVQEFDLEREKELAAAHKEANLRRSTPTGPVLNTIRTDFEKNWTARTPTPESFPKFFSLPSSR